jgi:hypothetical protein
MRPQFRFVSKFGFGRLGFGRFRFSQGLDDLVSFRFVSIYLKAFLLSFVSFHDIKTHKFLCPGFGSKKKTVSILTLTFTHESRRRQNGDIKSMLRASQFSQ